jgi:ribosomal protein S18 acetylase RimI-like enzyme
MKIRSYQPSDETQWLQCRVLAFLDTTYFDNVLREKERYPNPSIELVAELNEQIIGLMDVECEQEPGTVCSTPSDPDHTGKAGMIWNLAVHPGYRRRGIGKALLQSAIAIAQQSQIQRFEAWTRDDVSTIRWYEAQGFQKVDTHLHVYLQDDEVKQGVSSHIPGLKPMHVFAHYRGDAADDIKQQFRRVHPCNRYDLFLNQG